MQPSAAEEGAREKILHIPVRCVCLNLARMSSGAGKNPESIYPAAVPFDRFASWP